MSGGYLHAIDDQSRWNRDFGIEILGGLRTKNSSSSKKEKLAPGKLEKERREFLSMWEKFDWSKAL